jgi:hypothetical protein
MNLKRLSAMWLVTAAVLAGCPKDEDDETKPPAKPSATAAAPAPTPSATSTATQLATAGPTTAKPAVQARAKGELDGKAPDAAFTGTTVSMQGSKTSFTVPKEWKVDSGAWQTASAPDGKTAFTVATFPAGTDATQKRDAGAGILGYTECDWGAPESIKLGKDGIAATVSDGVCLRAGAPARTVATLVSEDGGAMTVGVSGWDAPGGDAAATFHVLRSAKKAAGGGDPTGIRACCSAIRQNAASQPLTMQGSFLAAAAACDALVNNPQGRAALGQVRALLGGAAPPACR